MAHLVLSKFSTTISFTPHSTTILNPTKPVKMAHKFASSSLPLSSSSSGTGSDKRQKRKLPILLFDIMDTIVRDPFYQDVPAFFRMSFKDLIACKHPTAWAEFEKGQINEMELGRKFFKDCRPVDLEGLKKCMRSGYTYIDGIETLLHNLKQNDYEMHAFSNYPEWYALIEEKLKISTYMSWTFCSCIIGQRKPDADAYLEVLTRLEVDPANCIFIDDRMVNVEAARKVGMVGIHFKDAASLEQDLSLLEIQICSTAAKDLSTQI